MIDRLVTWCDQNTHTFNLAGIRTVLSDVEAELRSIGAKTHRIEPGSTAVVDDTGTVQMRELAPVLVGTIRPHARNRVMLGIHVDTVYDVDNAFQTCRTEGPRLIGPGVADAKGGLLVMLEALRRFEATEESQGLGWDVFVNSDEEIGSPGSAPILASLAASHQTALVYEPSLPDGALVRSRKGSGTFTFDVSGQAAHAGRDFHVGRNAVVAASRLACLLHNANQQVAPALINVGSLHGGGAVNVVPDHCILRVNCRTATPADEEALLDAFRQAVAEASDDGISIAVSGAFHSPPRPENEASLRLLSLAQQAGRAIGLELEARPTGGSCDGNRLAALGLAVLDSLGVRGGHLHSPAEYVEIESLDERARLSAELLRRLAAI